MESQVWSHNWLISFSVSSLSYEAIISVSFLVSVVGTVIIFYMFLNRRKTISNV